MNPSWQAPPPCKANDKLEDIDTPALVLDMDTVEHNVRRLNDEMKKWPNVVLRPHMKAHKCPSLAKYQVENGAIGVCCQTLVEAEAAVYAGGVTDILLSNQIIGKKKLKRLAQLARQCTLALCVDSVGNIDDASEVARAVGVTINCVVEVNVGQERCGVEPGPEVAALAQHIKKLPGLTFKGIQCYQGWNQHVRDITERTVAVNKVVDLAKVTLNALQSVGIACDYVTGGGTGTFRIEAASGIFTEVQPGSYILMDADYGRNLASDGKEVRAREFGHALYVLTTVQSVREDQRAVVDAGMKAVSMDSGVPLVTNRDDLVYHIGGDEHGILRPSGGLKVGNLVKLIPGHCDPTVNLYDHVVCIREGLVENVWTINGRGPGV